MNRFFFIVIVAVYALVYIIRLISKARKAPPPNPEVHKLFFETGGEETGEPYREEPLPRQVFEPSAFTPDPPVFEPENPSPPAGVQDLPPKEEAAKHTLPVRGTAGENVFRKLESMDPLARAFVMNEILGKPKGMEDPR
jgi:hypothetical protein